MPGRALGGGVGTAGCNGDELCEYNCLVATSPMGQFEAGFLADCAEQNACALDDLECLEANCPDAVIECGL